MESGSRLQIDKVIHERARLMILAYLSASADPATGFIELREKLELTAGNLSIQLRNLEEAGYVKITKGFLGRKPNTTVQLTPRGSLALAGYLAEMEALIRRLKPQRDGNG